MGLTVAGWRAPRATISALIIAGQAAFLLAAVWKVLLILASPRSVAPMPEHGRLPRYTILAALHDEADVVSQLISRLARIDYPTDRLEGFILLEAHDAKTLAAAEATPRPGWLRIMVVPAGPPLTKPRALNYGLSHATGELLTIYDAEDDPDPGQLREAAGRFEADGHERLGCLQAPLRIRLGVATAHAAPFLDRQFALEYAALFHVCLPAMARLGLPFPLGGTSNHFRTDVLRQEGGWDAWNVTEDADLGFRLWRSGWTLGVLNRPTYETPPGFLDDWLPQRTRWLKGYMQTWGVHTRSLSGLGWRGVLALTMTVGAGLGSAAVHAGAMAWLVAFILVSVAAGLPPPLPAFSVVVFVVAVGAAWWQCAVGARRARMTYSAADMGGALAYWSLLSLAFIHAAWRLLREPFVWNKTAHRREDDVTAALRPGPPVPEAVPGAVVAEAGRSPV